LRRSRERSGQPISCGVFAPLMVQKRRIRRLDVQPADDVRCVEESNSGSKPARKSSARRVETSGLRGRPGATKAPNISPQSTSGKNCVSPKTVINGRLLRSRVRTHRPLSRRLRDREPFRRRSLPAVATTVAKVRDKTVPVRRTCGCPNSLQFCHSSDCSEGLRMALAPRTVRNVPEPLSLDPITVLLPFLIARTLALLAVRTHVVVTLSLDSPQHGQQLLGTHLVISCCMATPAGNLAGKQLLGGQSFLQHFRPHTVQGRAGRHLHGFQVQPSRLAPADKMPNVLHTHGSCPPKSQTHHPPHLCRTPLCKQQIANLLRVCYY